MGFITVLLAVIGILWGMLLALRGSLVPLVGVYLVIGAVFGFEWFHFDVGGITLSIDRLVLLAIIAGAALQKKLAEPRVGRLALHSADLVLLAFVAWLLMNTFVHDWRRSGPDQQPILPHLLEGYLIPLVLFAIVRTHEINPRNLQAFYWVMTLFGAYLAWTAVCEVAGLWSLVHPKYISNPLIGIHFGRARGPFLQSVRLGIYLMTALSMGWVTYIWQSRFAKKGQLVGLVYAALLILAIGLTFTRSIWIALAAGAAIVAAWTFQGGYRRAALFGIVMCGLLAVPLKDAVIGMKREYGSQETVESTKMRAVFAYVSWLMFRDHPLTGVGFGHFPHEKEDYLNDRQTNLRLTSIQGYVHHNSWLSLLTELGLPGFALYALVLALWARCAMSVWYDPLYPAWIRGHALVTMIVLTTVTLQMIFHEVSYSPFENGILFTSTGLMLSASQRR